jgi:hypothetical protein
MISRTTSTTTPAAIVRPSDWKMAPMVFSPVVYGFLRPEKSSTRQ